MIRKKMLKSPAPRSYSLRRANGAIRKNGYASVKSKANGLMSAPLTPATWPLGLNRLPQWQRGLLV